MSEKKKTEGPGLDIAGLLSLKTFEHPTEERLEKNIRNTMHAVRAAHKKPSLHLFPDKSMAWMFAQPRYGIAALFVIFLGLHLLQRPMPNQPVGSAGVQEPKFELDLATITESNNVPPAIPAMSTAGRTVYSSLAQPVSFNK